MSVLLFSGILASVYVPGKIGQRYRPTRSGRQLEEARILHDCEAPPAPDGRLYTHAALERLTGTAPTLHRLQPPDGEAALFPDGWADAPTASVMGVIRPVNHARATDGSAHAFQARPPPLS